MNFNLGIKTRSLPNYHNIGSYISAFFIPSTILIFYNLINIMLIQDGFPITFPLLTCIAIPLIFFRVYQKHEYQFIHLEKEDMRKVIMLIHTKHNQALIEEINERPELLKGIYKKHNLLYWCRHYQNRKAHSILTKKMHIIAGNTRN